MSEQNQQKEISALLGEIFTSITAAAVGFTLNLFALFAVWYISKDFLGLFNIEIINFAYFWLGSMILNTYRIYFLTHQQIEAQSKFSKERNKEKGTSHNLVLTFSRTMAIVLVGGFYFLFKLILL